MNIIENKSFKAVGGHDKAAFAINPDLTPLIIKNCVIDGSNSDWGLKSSNSKDIIVEDCIIKNGIERALDIVRGRNIKFIRCKFLIDEKTTNGEKIRKRIKSKFELRKECDVGIKAGVADVVFQDCEINDLLLGDYSIYDQIDRPKTRRITLLNCKNPHGGPIFIRGRYVDKKSIFVENTKVSIFVWPNFITKIYWKYNRKFGDKRPLIGEQTIITEEEKI